MIWKSFLIFFLLLCASGCGPNRLAPLTDRGAYLPPSNPTTVIVMAGDNLYSIAQRGNVTLADLIAENNLREPYVIIVGQTLRLPASSVYKVQPSDTLYSISRSLNISVEALAQINNLSPPYYLSIGDEIILPSRPIGSNANPERYNNSRLAALPKPGSRFSTKFLWPVQGAVITNFGPQGGGVHSDGIDIAVVPGTPILAAENGVVAYVGNDLRGLGNLLLIIHDGGWVTTYAHTQTILVSRGEKVGRGQTVATSGISETKGMPLLHFEIRQGTKPVDPVNYL